MNGRSEIVIAKTLIPNSVIIFSGIFLVSSSLILAYSENIIASIIYPIAIGIVLFAIWTFKSKYDCILVLTADQIKVCYFHPMQKNKSFKLKDIKSNIKVERYNGSVFIGSFTTIQDYLNYRWYFTSEEYVFSFTLGADNEMIEIISQPNLIGLKSFVERWAKQSNSSLVQSNHSDSTAGSLAKTVINLVVRSSIGKD